MLAAIAGAASNLEWCAPDKGNVDAHPSVQGRAVEANEDAIGGRCPGWVTCMTVKAHLVGVEEEGDNRDGMSDSWVSLEEEGERCQPNTHALTLLPDLVRSLRNACARTCSVTYDMMNPLLSCYACATTPSTNLYLPFPLLSLLLIGCRNNRTLSSLQRE